VNFGIARMPAGDGWTHRLVEVFRPAAARHR
jgi:hypothetical protein